MPDRETLGRDRCTATVYSSCTGCGPQVSLDSCPVRAAISDGLLGEGGDSER